MTANEISERVAAITPGQWEYDQFREEVLAGEVVICDVGMDWETDADGFFIAHAPDDIRFLLAEVERLQTALDAVTRERDAAAAALFWKSEHLRIYDYNRFGTIAFSGLPEQLPEPDVLRSLAHERKRFTVVMYLEDYQTPSDVEAAARQHDDAAERSPETVGG